MRSGDIAGSGTHSELLESNDIYSTLWHTQQSLENYGGGEKHE